MWDKVDKCCGSWEGSARAYGGGDPTLLESPGRGQPWSVEPEGRTVTEVVEIEVDLSVLFNRKSFPEAREK